VGAVRRLGLTNDDRAAGARTLLVSWGAVLRGDEKRRALVLVEAAGALADPEPPPAMLVVSQLAVTLATGGVPAGSMLAGGVPGGTLTVNVSVVPLRSVAVTRQGSAEAIGARAGPMPTTTRAIVPRQIFGFQRIKTCLSRAPRTERRRATRKNGSALPRCA
jgi:hypothetical protein